MSFFILFKWSGTYNKEKRNINDSGNTGYKQV